MLSPNTMEVFSLLSGSGLIFFIWHMWRYDGFRCLIPTRQDWFRALICYLMLASISLLFACGLIQMYVLYSQYFATINGITLPKPWTLWPERFQQLWRDSLYILAMGWACLQAVHLEEFLYWAHLMSSIRYPTGPKVSWVRSVYFKIWVGGTLAGLVLLYGAVNIERNDLEVMRSYLFLVGGASSAVLAIFSTGLCFAVPSFVRTVRSQGASYEVLDRLAFFAEMNGIRTVFRWIYSIAFIILSADGLSSAKPINTSPFASDLVLMTAIVAVLIVACLSVILLLPRNMTAEALPATAIPAKMRMVAYPRPRFSSVNPPHSAALTASSGGGGRAGSEVQIDQMAILGRRLNLDREAMGGMTEDLLELPHQVAPKPPASASSGASADGDSTREGYKASQSEEHIFTQQAAMEEAMGSTGTGSKRAKSPKTGVRWSEVPSILSRERQGAETPPMPAGSMSPRRPPRPSEIWVHTEETVKRD